MLLLHNAKKGTLGRTNAKEAQIKVTFHTDGGNVSSNCPLERFHYPLFIYPLHLSSFSLPPTALAIPHSGSLSFLCVPLARHPH